MRRRKRDKLKPLVHDASKNINSFVPELLARANANIQIGQADKAEFICREILANVPRQPDALHMLGVIAHSYGRLDDAIDCLRQACLSPAAPGLYWSNLAEMYRQRGLLFEGEIAARKAIALNPQLSSAWINLGIILLDIGKYEESRACLERARTWEPRDPRVLNNLGNVCLHQGDLKGAENFFTEALTNDPQYSHPYINLAKLYNDIGNFDKAIFFGLRAIEIDPAAYDAYINLAAAEKGRGQLLAALRWINVLLSYQPTNVKGLLKKALILMDNDYISEALDVAESAVQIAPNLADAHYVRGSVMKRLGRLSESLDDFAKAAELPGKAAEDALCQRAIILGEIGDMDTANNYFADAIARFPDSFNIFYNWSLVYRFKNDDPLLSRMESLLDQSKQRAPKDRLLLHFALGKAYLSLGKSTEAFSHLHSGNAIKRSMLSYQHSQTTSFVDRIISAFSGDQCNNNCHSGDNTDVIPVFIIGMPRSGTTLTEQILSSHSSIFGAGELSWLKGIVEDVGGFPEMVPTLTAAQKTNMGRAYLSLAANLISDRSDIKVIIDKMPFNFFYAGLIHAILPSAKIIHCLRDPVDTCLSCYSTLFSKDLNFAYNLREIGLFYRDYIRLTDHWRHTLPSSCLFEIEYERLVENLEGELRRILEFLDLDWDPACLEFHRSKRIVKTASFYQVRQPLYKHAIGRWKDHAEHLRDLLEILEI